MFRKATFLVAGVLLGAVAVLGVTQQAIFSSGSAQAQSSNMYRELDLFGEIFERILGDYVDEKTDVDLIEAAIDGMVQSLDPHSQYYPPEAFNDFQTDLTGEFGGLGIEITMEEDGFVHVVTPIDDTPAAEAGILAGDLIVSIDGEDVKGMTLDGAVDLMRGEPGTDVTITIDREGVDEVFDVTITRDIIRTAQVRYEAFGNVGYIRLTVFGTRTFEPFMEAVLDLTEQIGPDQIEGFILDLRNNGGGSLDTSISIADGFLEQGEIVSTRGRNPQDTQRYNAREGDLTQGLPLIVLVNGGSASASEIVAGALQDHRRATIVGVTSFGKGSVQTIFPLGPDLGAIRLTTARYFTPSGASIQDVGVQPDIVIEQPLPASVAERLDELPMDDEGNVITSFDMIPSDPEEDVQLQYALSLLRGEETNPAFPPSPETAIAE